MLTQAYAAIQQFQRQKYSVDSIQELEILLKSLNLSLDLRITSSSFWESSWSLLERKFSGTMEVGIHPILMFEQEIFQPRNTTTLRLEESDGLTMSALEFKILALIKQSIETIS